MRTLRLSASLVAILVLAATTLAFAGEAPTKAEVVVKGGNYTFAAAPSTSPVYSYWVAIAKAVQKVYPQFNITVTETTGALDITKRVRARQAAVGNSMGDLDYANYAGEEQFKGQPNKKARILWYFDHLIAQWAVSKASGIKTIEALTGKDFNPGGAGGGIVGMTKKTFELFGVKPRYFEGTQSSAMEAMLNRQIIGLSKAGPVPDSFFQQIAANMPIEMVGLTKDQQAKAIEKYPYWSGYTVPAKTYGDTQEAQTVAVLVGAQATSDLPEEVGYAFFKAMWEGGKSIWQAAYPSAANINVLQHTLQSSIPLHAGAVRYLKEQGVRVPDRLIPPEYKPQS
jgi:TRAP transporter TAXI family solute receptor